MVGVVLNLSVWFSLHVLFREVRSVEAGPLDTVVPLPASLDGVAFLLAVAAAAALLKWHRPIWMVLGGAALGGAVLCAI